MNASTNQDRKTAFPTVVSKKILYDKGSEWATVWFEDFTKIIRMLPESLFKKEMVSVLDKGKDYSPTFMCQEDVMKKYNVTDVAHAAVLALALTKETAQEILGMDAVRSQAHAVLSNQLERCAKAVVSADPAYRLNDELAQSAPAVTVACMKRILITEREGKGSVRKLMTKTQALSDILTITRTDNGPDREGLVDFRDRAERRRKAMWQNYGTEIIGTIFKDEEEWTLFWVSRLGPQYAQLQRDIENKILVAPMTLDQAVTMAKDRVEVTKKAHETVESISVFAAVPNYKPVKHLATKSGSNAKKSTTERETQPSADVSTTQIEILPPLEPYPFLSAEDYAKLPDADKNHIRLHNQAIKEAMEKLQDRMAFPRQPGSSFPREPKKEVRFHDQGSRVRVLAVTNDDLEELEPSFVLMNHPQGCIDLTASDSDMSNQDNNMTTTVEDSPMSDLDELTPYGETPWCEQASLVPYSDTDSDTPDREFEPQHQTMDPSCSESDPDPDIDLIARTPISFGLHNQAIKEAIANDPPPTTRGATRAEDNNSSLSDVLEEEDTYQCEINLNTRKIPYRLLSAPQSQYRTANYHRCVVSPGRGLICSDDIQEGQAIAHFKGIIIDHATYTSMSNTRSQYVLRLFEESDPPDALHYHQYLDCYERACIDPPTCLASMANSAEGLYDRHHDTTLTHDHNNADAVILTGSEARGIGVRTTGDHPQLVLYAQQFIPAGNEIMWDYDGLEILDDPLEGGDSKPTIGELHFQRAINGIARYSTAMEQAPKYAISIPPSPEDQPSVLVASTSPFDPHYIIWDCASGSNICKNPCLATNIKPCKPATVLGIVQGSEGVYTQSCSFLDPALGRCPLAENSIANIMSQAVALDSGFQVQYTSDSDRFLVKHPTDSSVQYVFGRLTGTKGLTKHYLMDTRTMMPPTTSGYHNTHTLLGKLGDCIGVDSVEQRAMKYTKNQIASADKAMDFMKCIGHPPEAQCLDMVDRMTDPPVTRGDIRTALDIYGPNLAAIRGRTTRTTTSSVDVPRPLGIDVVMEQTAEVDLMFVRKEIFLMCLLSPLEFSIVIPIESKTIPAIRNALDSIVSLSEARGFKITTLRIDNEPGVASLNITSMLAKHNILVDTVAAGDHVSKAERRIRFIKEKWRVLVHTLNYVPSKQVVKWGVVAANRLANMQKSSTSTAPESPREKFLGRRTDYKRDIGGIAFGTYVQARVPNPNNTDAPRTEACIALVPKDNQTGTFYVLKLTTNKAVSRSHLIPMPVTDALTNHLNREALKDGYSSKDLESEEDAVEAEENKDTPVKPEEGRGVQHHQPFDMAHRNTNTEPSPTMSHVAERHDPVNIKIERIEQHETTNSNTEAVSHEVIDLTGNEEPPNHHTLPKDVSPTKSPRRSSRLAEQEDHPYWSHTGVGEGIYDIPEREEGNEPATYTEALATTTEHTLDEDGYNEELTNTVEYVFGVTNTVEYVFGVVAGNMSCKTALAKHGDAALNSIQEEMFQFIDRGAFLPVRWSEMTFEQRKRIIPSMMFLKEKYTPEGDFERLKARLVARGDKQDRDLYTDDVSASTASSMSTFSVIAIAAHENRKVLIGDIPGAFLHADMKTDGEEVYLTIEPVLSDMLIKKYPDMFKEYLNKNNGKLTVKLLRAVYGTIEAAKLWLDDLTATLNKHGYTANPYDPCIFNMVDEEGNQCTICVYVDDLLITCKRQETIDAIVGHLNTRYGGVKTSTGKRLHYLGMILDFTTEGYVKITMDGMIEAIIAEHLGVDRHKTPTPSDDDLFTVDGDSPLIAEPDRQVFHTAVAKMLYVSKRVRPDCLTAVGFLVTRVTKATEQDNSKLQRLLRYVAQSHELNHKGITLHIGEQGVGARAWIDAAHGVHDDFKSTTGCAIGIGEHALVHYHSSKQPIIAKSSTEAELIAVTDASNQAIHLRSFLISQGYEERPAILYQDNMSAIALIKKGRSGSMKTRHIPIRYYWLNEQCEMDITSIVYKHTSEMGAANILTKSVVGGQFLKERQAITNWDVSLFV